MGIAGLTIELGGCTGIIDLTEGEENLMIANEDGILLSDIVNDIPEAFGRIGKLGEKKQMQVEYDFDAKKLTGRGIYTKHGFELDMEFTVDSEQFSGSGTLYFPIDIGQDPTLSGHITWDGEILFTAAESIVIKGCTVEDADITLSNSEGDDGTLRLSVKGWLQIPGFGSIYVSGDVNADGSFEFTGEGDLSPAGYTLADASVTLNNYGLRIEGKLQLPAGIGNVNVEGEVTPTSFSLTGIADLTLAGFTLPSASVTLSSNGVEVSGDVNIPASGGKLDMSGHIYTGGTFSLTGDGTIEQSGFRIVGSFTLSNTGFGGSVSVSLLNRTISNIKDFTIAANPDGSISRISGSGDVNWAGQKFSVTFSIRKVDNSLQVSSFNGSMSIGGTFSGYAVSGTITLSASTSGRVDAKFTGTVAGVSASVSVNLSGQITVGGISYPCGTKWCKEWGISYPCGTKWCKKTITITIL